MAAIDDLSSLLVSLPNYSLITEQMKLTALAGARIPDEDSVWPGEVDYVNTYDIYFAALNLLLFLKAQTVVRSAGSEGTSVGVDAPDWSSLSAYFRSQSPIIAATGNDVLGIVAIPDLPHVRRTNMRSGVGGYDNVDTDLG